MPTMLNIAEAAEFLGVSKSTLRRWEHAGKLPSVRTAEKEKAFVREKIVNKYLD